MLNGRCWRQGAVPLRQQVRLLAKKFAHSLLSSSLEAQRVAGRRRGLAGARTRLCAVAEFSSRDPSSAVAVGAKARSPCRQAPPCELTRPQLPDVSLSFFDGEGQMQKLSTKDLCSGKKVVLFAVPCAFAPTCSQKHVPGFVERADEFLAKGVDTIACVSVNDAFVMDAWSKAVGAQGKVLMLADGSGLLTRALGMTLDLTDKGLGVRSRRYAMLVEDCVVKTLKLEEGGALTVSSADELLAAL